MKMGAFRAAFKGRSVGIGLNEYPIPRPSSGQASRYASRFTSSSKGQFYLKTRFLLDFSPFLGIILTNKLSAYKLEVKSKKVKVKSQ